METWGVFYLLTPTLAAIPLLTVGTGPGTILVLDSPLQNIELAKQAVQANRNGKYFQLEDKELFKKYGKGEVNLEEGVFVKLEE